MDTWADSDASANPNTRSRALSSAGRSYTPKLVVLPVKSPSIFSGTREPDSGVVCSSRMSQPT